MAKATETRGGLVTGGAIDPGPSGPQDKKVEPPDTDRAEALAVDEDVATFRVRRLLGEGGMGQVYLARDLVLGRLVALKLVRPERLGPAGVSRFMREARITARFNHPHIVTIHGVGTHRGRPYLALEYLDGESLGARLARERLSVDEIMRIGRAIADALAHAHEARVLHCDLKPGNVVLASDGRLRVVDFGLAADAMEPESRTYAGTPTYMAPEQWMLEPLTDRVDVWALGVLLYECFEHAHPFAAERGVSAIKKAVLSLDQPRPIPRREGIPPEVARLVQSALAREPSLRPSAADCRTVLDTALSPLPGMGTAESPFRGLLAFEERHAQVFFGRETEIGAMLERLRSEAVIPVIGPSGVGKSSFVHAGLIPRLRSQGSWTILSFRPGNAPIRTLAHRLSGLGSGGPSLDPAVQTQSDDLATRIRATPAIAALRLSAIAAANRGKVLLVIDQLEELFTHVSDPIERERFLEAILNAADDVAGPVRVVLTVRDDFLGRVPGLKSLFVLGPPEKTALRRTITEPLRQVGYGFDTEGMVDTMLGELDGGQGELPLLQFALRQLWDARDDGNRVLLKRAYDRFGGVAGALADHADTLLSGLDSKELQVAKQLLLRLVSPDGTRLVLESSALLGGLPPASEQVLARLISGRLLIQRRSKDSGDPTIELAHESLIHRWARLTRWLDEGREERALAAELEEATKLWIRRGRPMEETWSGIALETVRHRVSQLGLAVSEEVSSFLQAGALRARQSAIKKRILLTVIATILVTTTAGALFLASEFRDRENEAKRQKDELVRAGANLGELTLELEPFDFADDHLSVRPVDVRELPNLSFTLHRASSMNPLEPGEKLSDVELHVEAMSSTITTRKLFRVEAPGIQAFLAIEGRNREGERCASSWLRLQSLPGFADRQRGTRPTLRVAFPTCQATRAGMIEVPPGELVFGGLGEPPVDPPSVAEVERVVSLPRFFIDRTEVSNGAFASFAALAHLSAEDLPNYPDNSTLANAADPRHPVTGVTARTAEAYCRYFGKRLPTYLEWVKVVRGGLTLPDGVINPSPRRLYSWTGKLPQGVNLAGKQDGCETSCAVDRPTEEQNVYGALHLHGNVQEWGSGWERPGDAKLFLPVMGGGFSDVVEDCVVTSAAANTREARYFDFQIGLRCLDANE